jgi:hypothetical protein
MEVNFCLVSALYCNLIVFTLGEESGYIFMVDTKSDV